VNLRVEFACTRGGGNHLMEGGIGGGCTQQVYERVLEPGCSRNGEVLHLNPSKGNGAALL
jgi:hypothetical protein